MYCSQCATELSDEDVICPNCSKPVASFSFTGPVEQVQPIDEDQTLIRAARPLPKPRKWLVPITIAVCVLAAGMLITLVGLGMYLAGKHSAEGGNSSSSGNAASPIPTVTATPATPTPTPVPTPKPKREVLDEKIEIPAGNVERRSLSLDADGKLTGGFVIYGDSHDVDFRIIDTSGHIWHECFCVDKEKVSVALPRGRYTFIFSNEKAWFTDKTVAAQFFFQEDEKN
jgi:hypothetical protein